MLDDLMLKRFDIRTYNCWDLTREVWLRLTGQVLSPLALMSGSTHECRNLTEGQRVQYREIQKPESPCIMLFEHPKHIPHVGVYIEGRVFHIRKAGVQYSEVSVASIGFTSVRYYLPCLP